MLVKDIMTKNPETLPPNTPIQKVAEEMQKLDCGFMPIATNGKIVGTVTDRDIAIRATSKGKDPKTTPIEEIMTSRSYYVLENDDVSLAAEKMCQHQIRRLIVLDKNKHISGVVSLGDIATKFKNHEIDAEIIEEVSEKK
ncbi:MAG: CBS domain-containing protein [Gammaproteobacteria bacterium]|nr:CBS domain-containing protein [Gammaproteobacteria bacterium]